MTEESGERVTHKTIARRTGEIEVTTVQLKSGGEVLIEEHANGALVIEQVCGPGLSVASRTCSGSCDGVSVGPINCPEGTSPHLDCTKNPPTLKCVKDEWA